MHDLTLMDFSQGGLGWLLGKQLMWNNLVPPGGELHPFRGNPHNGSRRTRQSARSSFLTCLFVADMRCQKRAFHLLRVPRLPSVPPQPVPSYLQGCGVSYSNRISTKDNHLHTQHSRTNLLLITWINLHPFERQNTEHFWGYYANDSYFYVSGKSVECQLNAVITELCSPPYPPYSNTHL